MKKVTYYIGVSVIALSLFFTVYLIASTWASTILIALEFLNGDMSNTGSGTSTFTNYGSIPYSDFNSEYSVGPVNTSGQYIQNTSIDSKSYRTWQTDIYILSSGLPMDFEILDDNYMYDRVYGYSSLLYYSDSSASPTQIGGYTVTKNTWVTLLVNWDGST